MFVKELKRNSLYDAEGIEGERIIWRYDRYARFWKSGISKTLLNHLTNTYFLISL